MNKLIKEDLAPFKLEKEKQRIWDVLSIMETIEYGFINQKTGERVTDRDWIHHNDLTDIYKTNADPLITLKNKLGICKDQAILFKFLMNKFHPEDDVFLYAVSTNIQGHCQPAYCHEGLWFMNDSSWDREHRLHGPFNSQEELEDYLNYVYYMNHKEDNDLESRDEVEVEELDKEQLLEDTRAQIVNQSRNVGLYKGDKTRGKNRFERKKWSKVANQVKSFNQLNMDDFFKKDQLDIKIPVTGEAKEYTVTVRINGVCAEIAKNIKNNNNIFEFKTVVQALTKCFNVGNVYVNCTCDDYCLHPDTKIKLLNGEIMTVKELCDKFNSETIPMYLYSTDENGDFKPGKITKVWKSGESNKMIRVTLDNGETIETTPEHPYMLRNGEYIPASELTIGQSLMPLYFSHTENGYETIKLNSKPGTQFFSTYKIVANELLQKEIEEAKIRSGENDIAIHHKNFIKSNNDPSNLFPMGVVEHYLYHSQHVWESGVMQKFINGGAQHNAKVADHSTEEYERQAQICSETMKKWWDSLTDEERNMRAVQVSRTTKDAWKNGSFDTEAFKLAATKRGEFLHTPEIEQKTAAGIREYWANLSEDEHKKRVEIAKNNLKKCSGWNKGKHLSGEDRKRKSEAALNATPEKKAEHDLKIRDSKYLKVFTKMIEDKVDLTEENYEICRKTYFPSGFPRISAHFNNINEAVAYFGLNHKVINIENVTYNMPVPVYDIAVENYHNFYVSAGVILHNCYRFNHWSVVNGIGTTDTAHDPGPGKGIANPNDDKGKGCKHVLLCLANMTWIMKVASVIRNYINYFAEHRKPAFNKLIFPKLYGVPFEAAAEENLVPDEESLETNESIIDIINDWAKNRGKAVKGSTVNPAKGKSKIQGPTNSKEEEEK